MPDKFTFILRPGETIPLGNLMTWIAARDQDKTWRVNIREDKLSRSDKQNSLQWLWHTVYGKRFGHSKDWVHNYFKFKFCLPIMLRDPEHDQLRRVWNLVRNDKEAIAGLVKVIHTSDLSTDEMAEALTEYDRHAASHGLIFPDPEEFKLRALS